MRYFRCKCGESTAWSSMGMQPCDVCEKCGSTYAESPLTHMDPIPHDWKLRYDVITGEPSHEVCIRCMRIRLLSEKEVKE